MENIPPVERKIDASTLRIRTTKRPAVEFWKDFGFQPIDPDTQDDRIGWLMPEGIIAFAAVTDLDNAAFANEVKRLPGPPMLVLKIDGCQHSFYRLAPGVAPMDAAMLPNGIKVLQAGDRVILPSQPQGLRAKSVMDLPILSFGDALVQPVPLPLVNMPLTGFSLRGKAAEFEKNAMEARPLLGEVCISGQATVWYAPPNAGKTLIGLKLLMDAVHEKRIRPGNVFYANADDSSEGFATKMGLMDDLGAHTLSPGHEGFEVTDLAEALREAVATETARGVLVIIDTLKKFADLMNKGQASTFADACRQFVMAGGTILAFAHTNKNATSTGKLTYTGTADIVQDFDAAYIMTPLEAEDDDRVVEFTALKRRGGGTSCVAYVYSGEDDISYQERLASVRLVDGAYLNNARRAEEERADEEVIAAIKTCIELGISKKMALAKTAAGRAKVSERRALRVIEAYTGEDPDRHRWTYQRRERGAMIFQLLPEPEGKGGIA